MVVATSSGQGSIRIHQLPEMSDVYGRSISVKIRCHDGDEHAASGLLPGRGTR